MENQLEKYREYIPRTDIYLFHTGKAVRAYLLLGCHYIAELRMHRFAVFAPNAKKVNLTGDFNAWDSESCPMFRFEGGIWFIFVKGVKNGDIYKYRIVDACGNVREKADPFAFHAETGPGTGSKVWDIEGYEWHDARFLAKRARCEPRRRPMSIYEVHLGSWRIPQGAKYPWYRETADELAAYCRAMGYTHVELMPVTEHPFEGSWGYQVTGYFAPTSRYGTAQDLMYFIDTLHAAGIGVILDWVPGHFPKDEHGLRTFDGTALFEHSDPRRGEHPQWGTLVFDFAKPEVRSFLTSSAVFFFDRYHIDGIRVDAVSSMLYLDYGRGNGEYIKNRRGGNIDLDAAEFLRGLNTAVTELYPGAVTVAEEATSYKGVTQPAQGGGLGFTFKWDMGFMHDTLDYMSIDHLFRSKCHEKLTFSMMYAYSEHFILPYSHDEVVHGKKSMIGKMFGSYEEKFSELRTLYAFQYAHPGKKLTFMGSEWGQFIEWDYKKELDWFLLRYPSHDSLRAFSKALNRLYLKYPALWENDEDWDGFKWLNVDDRSESCIALMRIARGTGCPVICAFNFTPRTVEGFTAGLPCAGRLSKLLSSDERRFGGGGLSVRRFIDSRDVPFSVFPASVRLTLAPLSAVFYKFTPYDKI